MKQPADHGIASSPKMAGLDAWRGILSVTVCLSHSWECFIYPFFDKFNWAHVLAGYAGRFSVLGFFIASGIAISHSVKGMLNKHGHFSPAIYIARRADRLIPPLAFSAILCVLLELLYRHLNLHGSIGHIKLPRNDFNYHIDMVLLGFFSLGTMGDMTGTINGPLWTFAIELECYALVGFTGALLFFIQKRNTFFAIAASIVFLYFLYKALFPCQFFQIFAWIIFLLAFWINYINFKTVAYIGRAILLVCMILIGACLALGNNETNLIEINRLSRSTFPQILFCLGFAAIIFKRQSPEWLLKFNGLGRSSFTLYIIHFPLQFFAASYLLPRIDEPKAIAVPLCLLATFSCTVLAHWLAPAIEKRWIFNVIWQEKAAAR